MKPLGNGEAVSVPTTGVTGVTPVVGTETVKTTAAL